MTTPDEGIASQLRNIEQTYGRTVDDLVKEVAASGLVKHPEVVAMLKQRFDMKHGAAHRVALVARERLGGTGAAPAASSSPTVQATNAALLKAVAGLGDDIEEAPKKGYVSLRRRRQFAMVQVASKWVNLGLILPGVEPRERLEPAAKWNALFTHRVRLTSADEVDDEVRAWLGKAYRAAG